MCFASIACIWHYFHALRLFAMLVCERDNYKLMPLSICQSNSYWQKIAGIQGFLPIFPILNSKFMEWSCYMLAWSWSLLRACGIDFTLLFFDGDWTKVSLHIVYFMCFIPCEKSHLLHAPPWLLLTCDIIFTWLQNLIVIKIYAPIIFLFISIFFMIILINFNHVGLYWIVIVRCWLPTLDTYILCKCNCLHFPWCCEVQTSVAHVKTTNLIDLNNSICNYLLWCQKGICLCTHI